MRHADETRATSEWYLWHRSDDGKLAEILRRQVSSQTLALSAASGSVGDCSSASFDDVISSSF